MLLRAHGVRTLDDAAGSEVRGIAEISSEIAEIAEIAEKGSEGRGGIAEISSEIVEIAEKGSEGRGGIAEGACGGGLTQIASAVVEAAPVTVAPSLLWLTGQQVDAALLMKADDC